MYRTSPIFTADQFLHLKQVLGNLFYLLGKTSPTANSNSEKLCKLSEQALVDYEQGCGVQAIQLSVLQRQSFCSWEGIFPFTPTVAKILPSILCPTVLSLNSHRSTVWSPHGIQQYHDKNNTLSLHTN